MKKINVGLIGFGTVGAGVIKILRERKTLLADKIKMEINIKKVCDKDIVSKRNVTLDKSLLTKDVREILDDPQIDVVVELMGGINPAKEFISEALKKGKNVVTANKALLAEHGKEMMALATDRDRNIYFEASVGAGIPIIKALREGLVANKFNSIFGIVNGTCNFILSEMSQNGKTFADALKEAQKKGFAESNSTLDIEGIDSAHKLVILAYLGFGKWVGMNDVFIEGISRVSSADVNYAKELGFEIKLLVIAKKESGQLELRVHPTFVPKSHLLSLVSGVYNAIYASSDLAGNLLFYGPGAGQLSAASAVVSDLVDLAQDMKAGLFKKVQNIVPDSSVISLRKIDDIESRYYIRFTALDKPGVLAKISGVLAKFGISIASVSQKERSRQEVVPVVIIIHEAKEKNLRQALDVIEKTKIIKEKPVAIRIEEA